VLMALLCYLCCFFQYKSLENKPKALIVCFALTGDKYHANCSYLTISQILCLGFQVLYSFFCYVSWVAFGRKDLKEIQDEIGRILYSNKFNAAVKPKEEVPSRRTSTVSNISESKTGIQHVAPGCHSALNLRLVLHKSHILKATSIFKWLRITEVSISCKKVYIEVIMLSLYRKLVRYVSDTLNTLCNVCSSKTLSP
uniref:Uncharacterized protein n=1 Tax=Neogobius melanostomus TaxID=47308 RepID=A0A8C6WLK5_9GOBI